MSQIEVTVTDTTPAEAAVSPPVAVGLIATAIPRGIIFTWSLDVWIQPYVWQYRLQVETEGWSSWIDILFPIVIRTLTAVELAAVSIGADGNIQIQVRSTDGLGNYSGTETANDDCLTLDVQEDDFTVTSIPVAALTTGITNRIFNDATKSLDEVTQGSTKKYVTVAQTADIALADAHLDANGLKAGSQIGGTLASTVVSGAADGVTTKATVDAGATNWDSAHANYLSQAQVDVRVTTVRPDANYLNSNTTKANVGLSNVDNKSSATIRGEIVDANLGGTSAILEGAWSAFIAAAGQNDTIPSSAVVEVRSTKVVDDTTQTSLFDSSGNLTFGALGGIGIKDGAGTPRTPAMIEAVVGTDSSAKNIDITSWKSGQTTANIPGGNVHASAQFVSANEKTGASRAYAGLSATGRQTVGTTNYTVAEIEDSVADDRIQVSEINLGDGIIDFVEHTVTVAGVGNFINAGVLSAQKNKGDTSVTVRGYGFSQDGAGNIRADLYTEAGVIAAPAVNDFVALVGAGVYALFTLTLTIPVGDIVGTWYQIRMSMDGTTGQTHKFKNLKIPNVK